MRITAPSLAWLAAALLAAALASGVLLNTGSDVARADDKCAAQCNAARDQCMASTHDSDACNIQRNQCLKKCYGG